MHIFVHGAIMVRQFSLIFPCSKFSLSDSRFSLESLTPKDISFLIEGFVQSTCFISQAFSFEIPSFLIGIEV